LINLASNKLFELITTLHWTFCALIRMIIVKNSLFPNFHCWKMCTTYAVVAAGAVKWLVCPLLVVLVTVSDESHKQ